jgi:hypothetical protein
MSTICTETLNRLCDVEGLSTNVMSKIEELDKLCQDALLRHGEGDGLFGAEKVEELLSRLSLDFPNRLH